MGAPFCYDSGRGCGRDCGSLSWLRNEGTGSELEQPVMNLSKEAKAREVGSYACARSTTVYK